MLAGIWWILITIAVTGILGGLVSFGRERYARLVAGDASDSWLLGLLVSILFSILAAFLVPLFLEITSSNILNQILDNAQTTEGEGSIAKPLLIFAGFCIVAALAPANFVTSVSQRVTQQLEQVERDVRAANEAASEALNTAEEIVDEVEEDDTDDAPAPAVLNVRGVDTAPSPDQQALIRALGSVPHLRRSVSGLRQDIKKGGAEQSSQQIEGLLEELNEAGVVRTMASRKGSGSRYKLTAEGVRLARSLE